MALGWWVTVPTARKIVAVRAAATALALAPTSLVATPMIQAPAATATADARPPVFSTPPYVTINTPAATATSHMSAPYPTVAPAMDTFIDFQTMANGAINVSGWVTTQIGAGSALPTISGGRMVQNSTGTAAAAGYLTKQLSDGGRAIHARFAVEIISNTTVAPTVAMWQYFMNQGQHDGHLQRASNHVYFTRTGYVVQKYSTAEGGGTNLYQVTYPSSPGAAVQYITMTLDVAAQALTIVGGDGVTRRHPTIGGNNLLTDWPCLYPCIEIYDVNPSVDDARILYFGADSVVRAAAFIPPETAPRAAAAAVAPVISGGMSITAVAATATASAAPPVIGGATVTINPPAATATASAPVPSAPSTGDATITSVAATATAAAGLPAPTGGLTITAVAATATAAAAVPVISIKASYADAFTRANAATLGTGWTGRTATVLKVDTNVAVPDTLSSFCLDSYDSGMNTDDHKITAVINAAPSGTEGCLIYIRSNNTDSQIYAYMVNASQWLIYSHTSTYNGSLSAPTQRAITAGANSFTAADSLSFEATGNAYAIKKNGTSILTWTDSGSAVPTGSTHRGVAICYYASAANHGIDSFAAVDL